MQPISSQMRLYAPTGARLYTNTNERKRFLEAAELASPPIRSLCLVLLHTGCRVSEALSLTPASIEQDEGLIAIQTLKKRSKTKIREVPVPETLIDYLTNDHRLDRPMGRFPHLIWPICRSTAWRQVKAVMDEAQIIGPQATAKNRLAIANPGSLRCQPGHSIKGSSPCQILTLGLDHQRDLGQIRMAMRRIDGARGGIHY